MPTIELVSVDCTEIPELPALRVFATRPSLNVVSDRGLFQSYLDKISGVMIHLGRTSEDGDHCWFCGHAIEWDDTQDDVEIKFTTGALDELIRLMRIMQDLSPQARVVFLTDYQCDRPARVVKLRGLVAFTDLARRDALQFNCLYDVAGGPKTS